MLTKIAIKIMTMIMPLVIALNGFTVSLPFFNGKAEIDYVFANDAAGSAAGHGFFARQRFL